MPRSATSQSWRRSLRAGFHATYLGPDRTAYLRVLGAYVSVVGGRLEPGPDGFVAVFDERRIAIRFGSKLQS